VTFGLFRPVVLVPESFQAMSLEAQTGILCHELIHVRRRDWMITIFEEINASMLWFHPAIWWLLSQTRLVREQPVDAEVVQLTANHEPYINAVLEIAGARPRFALAPAPLFLSRRHLAERMRSLLTEVSMSKRRLFASYVAMLAIVTLAGWTAPTSFPLTGQAETLEARQESNTPGPDEGFVVRRPVFVSPVAPGEAVVQGEVVVELTFNVNGDIVDSGVLSGPEELRQRGLQTALRGGY
jgi:hypothetical protein